jgi:hypothetical protein
VVVAFSNLIESYPTRHGKIRTGFDHAGGIGVHSGGRTVITTKPSARRRQDLLDVVELINPAPMCGACGGAWSSVAVIWTRRQIRKGTHTVHGHQILAFILVGQSGCYV